MNDVWTTISRDPVIIGEAIVLVAILVGGYFWLTRTEIRADESEDD